MTNPEGEHHKKDLMTDFTANAARGGPTLPETDPLLYPPRAIDPAIAEHTIRAGVSAEDVAAPPRAVNPGDPRATSPTQQRWGRQSSADKDWMDAPKSRPIMRRCSYF